MKTEMLFMKDCYLKEFEGKVIERGEDDRGNFVVLDKTIFYPTGGGQPGDRGTLNGIIITAVIKEKGIVKHYTESAIEDNDIKGKLDWERRHEFMRMHTAQHLLSAIVLDKWGSSTAGNQIDKGSSRIDFRPLEPVEDFKEIMTKEFNGWVDKEAPVNIYFSTREAVMNSIDEKRRTLFARIPEFIKDIRVVEIEGIDKVPCGGTHVANTEELGHIVITKVKNKGSKTYRVRFELKK
ncbi:MAG: alanyl-tRNA editing protein [Candidatus Peribacteraceae bacterium]|nr:alanyl-tRNA editing protein [Candidatus Peribacteraceae bacterium]